MGDRGGRGVEVTGSRCRWWVQSRDGHPVGRWRWQVVGDQGGGGVEVTGSRCRWWAQSWDGCTCPVSPCLAQIRASGTCSRCSQCLRLWFIRIPGPPGSGRSQRGPGCSHHHHRSDQSDGHSHCHHRNLTAGHSHCHHRNLTAGHSHFHYMHWFINFCSSGLGFEV